jgi:hypothetical protein
MLACTASSPTLLSWPGNGGIFESVPHKVSTYVWEKDVALPKGTETSKTLELQAIVAATHEKELEAWPLATSADYAVIGQFITLFSYIDLNLR